jgi:hypothetical protein
LLERHQADILPVFFGIIAVRSARWLLDSVFDGYDLATFANK